MFCFARSSLRIRRCRRDSGSRSDGVAQRPSSDCAPVRAPERAPRRRCSMPAAAKGPDTIVLVHGLWVTPRSWEHWISRYEAKGYRVLAPAYPGLEVEVEALNADPTPVERLKVPAIIAHLESLVAALDTPPILMGHSAGGTFVQILLDHGFGAAGVTFNSAP